MYTKTTIWTLSSACNLLSETEEMQKEVLDIIGKDKISFGNRPDYGNQLMPGIEYFVPAVPKCLGRYLDNPGSPQAVKDIYAYYRKENQSPYTRFWDEMLGDTSCLDDNRNLNFIGDSPCFNDNRSSTNVERSPLLKRQPDLKSEDGYCMKTEKYTGYYEFLEKTAPNLLVGYSQGGFISRYLFWLDRVVFKKNIIRNVITISSPVFGSCLANPENTNSILLGIVKIILIALGIKLPEKTGKLADVLELYDVREFIKMLYEDMNSPEHMNQLGGKDCDRNRKFKSFLIELYNWTGGLRNDSDNAFYDFNIFRMDPGFSPEGARYSVLGSMNTGDYGPAAECYGIVSVSMNIGELLYELLCKIIKKILSHFLDTHKRVKDIFHDLKIDISGNTENLTRGRIEKINHIYRYEIMNEHSPVQEITNPLVRETINRLNNGVKDISLPDHGNDLIIPSAYQLTLDSKGMIVPGHNFIHHECNHFEGSTLNTTAGRNNRKQIIAYLKEIFLEQ